MHIAKVGAHPGFQFGGEEIVPPRPGRRAVVLSKAERKTLERAGGILSRLRRAMDPDELEPWEEHGYQTASSAEAYVTEVASIDHFPVVSRVVEV